MSPLSTTTRTPSMVSDVSAIEVASTILRRPAGARRDRKVLGAAVQRAIQRRDVDVSALDTRFQGLRDAADFALAWKEDKDRAAFACERLERDARDLVLDTGAWVATDISGRDGKARPWLSISGASPRSARTRAPSSVADITSSLKSSRKPCCASSAKARPRSASSERS